MRHLFLTFSLFSSLFLTGCATSNYHSEDKAKEVVVPKKILLDEPDRLIHSGDLMRITLQLPGRKIGILEKVLGYGEVPTPDGSMIKAADLTLQTFRANLAAYYAAIPGNEEAKLEAYISSSPYAVVKYNPDRVDPSTIPVAVTSTNKIDSLTASHLSPPTIYRRNFESPLTLWKAIDLEGGIPKKVNPKQIRVLKATLVRKAFDCSGNDGLPDGATPVESGDYIFLVPDDVEASKIFE